MSVVSENGFSLEGKRVLITGAAGALGRAVSDVAESLGAELVLVDLAFSDDFRPDTEKHIVNLTDTNVVNSVLGGIKNVDAVLNIAGGFNMGPAVYLSLIHI